MGVGGKREVDLVVVVVQVAGWEGVTSWGVNFCVRQMDLAMGVKKGALQCIVPRDGG